jgi:hypothetical protein
MENHSMSGNQASWKASFNTAVPAFLVALAMTVAASPMAAQDTTLARVYQQSPDDCSQLTPGTTGATASAVCSFSSPNVGSGTATATIDNATRTVHADGYINASGTGHTTPTASSAATMRGQVVYAGSEVPSNLVFQYAVTQSEGATGPAFSFGDTELSLYDEITNPTISWRMQTDYVGEISTMSDGVWTDGNGLVTITVPFDGTIPFSFATYVQGDGNINNYNNGGAVANGNAFGDITSTLTRVYATNGDWTSSDAQFDAFGNGTITAGQADTTPEPGALMLLGTGLIGLAPAIRRWRVNV